MIFVRVVAPVSDGPRRGESLSALVKVVHDLNLSFFRAHPKFPSLYASGVKYGEEPRELREQFCTAPAVLAQGWGDCDDLAPWLSAELSLRGRPALPLVRRVGPRTWHVVVQCADGEIMDPSRVLGMKGP